MERRSTRVLATRRPLRSPLLRNNHSRRVRRWTPATLCVPAHAATSSSRRIFRTRWACCDRSCRTGAARRCWVTRRPASWKFGTGGTGRRGRGSPCWWSSATRTASRSLCIRLATCPTGLRDCTGRPGRLADAPRRGRLAGARARMGRFDRSRRAGCCEGRALAAQRRRLDGSGGFVAHTRSALGATRRNPRAGRSTGQPVGRSARCVGVEPARGNYGLSRSERLPRARPGAVHDRRRVGECAVRSAEADPGSGVGIWTVGTSATLGCACRATTGGGTEGAFPVTRLHEESPTTSRQ